LASRLGGGTWSILIEESDACSTELVTLVHLDQVAPEVGDSQRVDFESEDHFGYRWWRVDEITCSDQRFYPRCLAALLRSFLAGDQIAEPLEQWPEIAAATLESLV